MAYCYVKAFWVFCIPWWFEITRFIAVLTNTLFFLYSPHCVISFVNHYKLGIWLPTKILQIPDKYNFKIFSFAKMFLKAFKSSNASLIYKFSASAIHLKPTIYPLLVKIFPILYTIHWASRHIKNEFFHIDLHFFYVDCMAQCTYMKRQERDEKKDFLYFFASSCHIQNKWIE